MSYGIGSTNVWPIADVKTGVAFADVDGAATVPIGKYYGERYVGNVAGVTVATNGEGRMVWEFDVDNYADAESKALRIPEGYARVTAVYAEVETAWTAGDVDVTIGGTTVLTATKITLDGAVGMHTAALTATDINRTISSGEDVKIILSGESGVVGKAKVIVEFTRV